MQDPNTLKTPTSGERLRHTLTEAQEVITAREQAARPAGGPVAGTVTEDGKRPTITLRSGTIGDAREAAAVWRDLGTLLAVDPSEFRTLLALSQNCLADADPKHFDQLWANDFLEMDRRTIQPAVHAVLLNSYEDTREGPVIAPLRLQDEADRPVAEAALAQRDQWVRHFATGKRGKGRSPD